MHVVGDKSNKKFLLPNRKLVQFLN